MVYFVVHNKFLNSRTPSR